MTSRSKAQKTASTFQLDCRICCDINATPEAIWALLTDAEGFPAWNSTVSRIDGTIALGERLALKVPLAPERTFKPKVTKFVPNREMEWSDGFAPMFRGVRTFTLTSKGDRVTEFSMSEVFSGLMLPMIKGSLPDFGPAFEAYAADLKRAAEARAS
jgi:hypothetical protein